MDKQALSFFDHKKFDVILGYDIDIPSVFNIFKEVDFLLCSEN